MSRVEVESMLSDGALTSGGLRPAALPSKASDVSIRCEKWWPETIGRLRKRGKVDETGLAEGARWGSIANGGIQKCSA